MTATKSSRQSLAKGIAAIQPIQNLLTDRSPTYREVAYTMIKEAILAGQLESGQPLIEEKLASMLKISRTPVREALATLEHEGLLTSFYKCGLYVHSVTRAEFIALFAANEAVEPAMARRAAISAAEQQLADMRAAIDTGGALRRGRRQRWLSALWAHMSWPGRQRIGQSAAGALRRAQ